MARELKVYYINIDGSNHDIVAASTKRAARLAFGVSAYYFNKWADETGSDEDVAVAMSKPGAVFRRKISAGPDEPYIEV